jgi:hypothetical protein
MKDGIYYINIHDYFTIIKIIDNKPFLSDRKKKGSKWRETILEDKRMKKLKPFSEIEMVDMIQGTFNDGE